MAKGVLIVTSLMMLLSSSVAFNLDLKSATVYVSKEEHSFGRVVALFDKWLVIGQPYAESGQKRGSVLLCKPGRVNSCKKLPFNTKADFWDYLLVDKTNKMDNDKGQSLLFNQPQMTCLSKLHDAGMCWVTSTCGNATNDNGKASRLRNSCVDGFSAGLLRRSRGQMVVVNQGSLYDQYGHFKVTRERKGNVIATTHPTDDRNTFIGYSSALVDFDGDGEDDYVVGVPVSADGVGKIEIYAKNLTLIGTIEDDKTFSEFGRTVATGDFNGDGRDEIIVGAPKNGTGRVYILYHNEENGYSFKDHDVLGDDEPGGMNFGAVVRVVGDINLDGYDDLCVGAPLSEDNNGSVSIFYGSVNGIGLKPTQVIYGSDFTPPRPMFGQSISEGIDQDDNQYPDILIGAEGAAVYLRARPVVSDVTLRIDSKSHTGEDCDMVEKCINIHFCIVSQEENDLTFIVKFAIDPTKRRAVFSASKSYKLKMKMNVGKASTGCLSTQATLDDEKWNEDFSPIPVKATVQLPSKSKWSRKLQPTMLPKEISDSVLIPRCGSGGVCVPDLYVNGSLIYPNYGSNSSDLVMMVTVGNYGEEAKSLQLEIHYPQGVLFNFPSDTETPDCREVLMPQDRHVLCNIKTMAQAEKIEYTVKFSIDQNERTQDSTSTSEIFMLHINSSDLESHETLQDNSFDVPIDYSLFPLEPMTTTEETLKDEDYVIKIQAPRRDNGDSSTAYDDSSNGTAELSMAQDLFRFNGMVNIKEIDESFNNKLTHTFLVKYIGNQSFGQDIDIEILWPGKDKEGRRVLTITQPLAITNGVCNVSMPDCQFSIPFKKAANNTEVINESPEHCTIILCTMSDITPGKEFSVTIVSTFDAKDYLERRKDAGDDKGVEVYKFVSEAYIGPIGKDGMPLKLLRVSTKLSRSTSSAASTTGGLWTSILLVTVLYAASLL